LNRLSLALLLSTGCAAPYLPPYRSMVLDQPYVLELSPAEGCSLSDPVELTLRLLERIDLEGLKASAVALIRGVKDASLFADANDLVSKLESGEVATVALQYL